MTDYYHFFGIKDKENRFTMRCKNPMGFDINEARLRLDQLFSAHGACPAINDMTWKLWKAGKEIKQWWWVTPNRLGIIKSALPLLILDGINYKGSPIYLVSLTNPRLVYASKEELAPYEYTDAGKGGIRDMDGTTFSGSFKDFYQMSYGSFDPANMSGVFINLDGSNVFSDTIKSWVELGNVFVDIWSYYYYLDASYVRTKLGITYDSRQRVKASVGDYLQVVPTDDILYPIINQKVAFSSLPPSGNFARIYSASPPSGYTYRPLVQLKIGTSTYDYIGEMTHTASKGKFISIETWAGVISPDYWGACWLPSLWYITLILQYPLLHYEIIQGNAPSKYGE
ncbi:MAG: hypothetical protein H3Z53_05640 [archaeon]|nr:hypothetical protein [archaeon]